LFLSTGWEQRTTTTLDPSRYLSCCPAAVCASHLCPAFSEEDVRSPRRNLPRYFTIVSTSISSRTPECPKHFGEEAALHRNCFTIVNKVGRGFDKAAQHTENYLDNELVSLFTVNNFCRTVDSFVERFGKPPKWTGMVK